MLRLAAVIGIATLFRYFPKKEYLMMRQTNAIAEEWLEIFGRLSKQHCTKHMKKSSKFLDYYVA